ncbi:tetratricopeptide repeat protein [Actinoplanes subglobosus]|uniref:Tetratricopeptide repeat protein n=1 Tax=Actinoplanes subglobosus TaxID=1547892 RepID=A0ABV8ILJ6_9ACTN
MPTFAALPDPVQAGSVEGLVERLRLLKAWAGDPSYETIKDRINAAWTTAGRPASELARRSTVANCFQPGRRRFNSDLVLAVVEALHPEVGYVAQWRQALRLVAGEIEAVALVRVQDSLPEDPKTFSGRTAELDKLRSAARGGDALVISAIEGMAGVGKTQLAVHAGHLLVREDVVDRVLFVNLRGFHPDETQPPADPAAVLDGFLRLLGVPGQQIPHEVTARTAAYRERLAGTRTLVLLDNAANADQVRPLLPATPGCTALITSRRSLADLGPAARFTVDVFTPEEALEFLSGAVSDVPIGSDPDAPARITLRCGYLPLALSLTAGHIRGTPGWTLTDHADRLDERHRDRRLDSGVEVALSLSYQSLPAGPQRLLRLVALHPGQDLDSYAAAALADVDVDTARSGLRQLCRDHLLQPAGEDRFTFHDIVRAYATSRAHDQDAPQQRRTALTRLFDYYLATTAAAMDSLYPVDDHRRPRVPPASTPVPDLTGKDTALAWLNAERPNLVAVTGHTATHGWPGHTIRLAHTLYRYLNSGYRSDELIVHGHAHHAARDSGNLLEQGWALTNLGTAHLGLGRAGWGIDYFRQALDLFRRAGDTIGEARALSSIGIAEERSGNYDAAIDNKGQALAAYQKIGDRVAEGRSLRSLGLSYRLAGRLPEAIDFYGRSLALAAEIGDRISEATTLNYLGEIEMQSQRYGPARAHLEKAVTLHREQGNLTSEASSLDNLGLLHTRLGEPERAIECHRQALDILRRTGDQYYDMWVLNGLGEASLAAGRPADALTHLTAACSLAAESGARDQQARAHIGLGHSRAALGERAQAREHYGHALDLYTGLGLPEADEVRARLAEL